MNLIRKIKLKEGGNMTMSGRLGDRSATKIQAAKMSKSQFEQFKKDTIEFLYKLSDIFEDYSGTPLWEDDIKKELSSGNFFSGSTRTMFQKSYEEYTKYKPTIGDLDVQVPKELEEYLTQFLDEKGVDLKVGPVTIYGNETCWSQSHILATFDHFKGVGTEYVQIDFEYVEYDEKTGRPSEFDTFGHYSSWEDLKHNIKGAFQKRLLQSICNTVNLKDITVVSEKTGEPLILANRKPLKSIYEFDVDKGLKVKYEKLNKKVNGKEAWKEVSNKYIRDLEDIFEKIFGEDPSKDEIEMMYSYVRTVRRLKDYFEQEEIEDILIDIVEGIWGENGQQMSKFDKEEDREWKESAVNLFTEENDISDDLQDEIADIEEEYYENFVEKQRSNGKEEKEDEKI